MVLERLVANTERTFAEKFVQHIENCFAEFQKKSRGSVRFVLGLSGPEGDKRRGRVAEIFGTLAESQSIDWGRVCVFLVDERYGAPEDQTNAHLVRSSLFATLKRRNISGMDEQFIVPNTTLDSVERCASDYQAKLLSVFKQNDGPHLIALGLNPDESLSGIFPEWYETQAQRWLDVTSKSLRILSTRTSTFDIPDRVCVNLGIVRKSRNIIVNVNESTDQAWARTCHSAGELGMVAADDSELTLASTTAQAQADVIRRTLSSESVERRRLRPMSSGPTRYLREMSIDEGDLDKSVRSVGASRLREKRRSTSPQRAPTHATETPLEYVMKYKNICTLQLKVDEENHSTIIVLGAGGDLAKKKTFPALFQLHLGGHLSASCRIIGCDDPSFHKDIGSTEEFWERRLTTFLEQEAGWKPQDLRDFRNRIDFMPIKLSEPGTMNAMDAHIRTLAKGYNQDNRVWYLALPSSLFAAAVERVRTECWPESGFTRVIVEKPFGRDYHEAHELAQKLGRHLDESEIYRIDHYLAKTLVLNILTLRFANREFGTLFHTYHVANVRITFQENFGVEGRAGYFDDYGIIRDIMQNHLMQVLTLIAMEAPATLDAEDVRDEKVKVLKQIRAIVPEDCVIGQYEGYQDDERIKAINDQKGYASRCATFAVAVMYLDNDRWSGVPFIMKAGKALKTTQTLVRIQFKKAPPHSLFGDQPQNEMVIRIQPNEGIYYKMLAKMPGISQKAKDVRRTNLDLDLKRGADRQRVPLAYEKLIYDVLQGESHNFVRRDELEQAWRIFDPLMRSMEQDEKRVPLPYKFGSGGPRAADELITSKGFQKYTPTGVAVDGFSDDEAGAG